MSSRSFVVPGDPLAKERPRFDPRSGRTYTPGKTAMAESLIALSFRRAPGGWPVAQTGEFAMTFVFYRANRRARDVDNMMKLIMDALNGIAYRDDSQVVETHCAVIYGDPKARAEVTLTPLEDVTPCCSCPSCLWRPLRAQRDANPS